LIRELDGKSVVSADHGELLGERLLPFTSRKYGHFEYLAAEQLRRVPWHVVDSDDRRRIVADAPIESARMDDEGGGDGGSGSWATDEETRFGTEFRGGSDDVGWG